MTKPTIRDSRIPCKNCSEGTLHWNPEEKLYVCQKCGIQEAALKTWIESAVHRKGKKKKKREKERNWALNILGVEDGLKKPKKLRKEQEWSEIIEKVKRK